MAAWLQAGKPQNGKPTLAYDPTDPQDTGAAEKKAKKAAEQKAKNAKKAAQEKAKKAGKGIKPPTTEPLCAEDAEHVLRDSRRQAGAFASGYLVANR